MGEESKLTEFGWGQSYALFNGGWLHVEQVELPALAIRGKRKHEHRWTAIRAISGKVLVRMFEHAVSRSPHVETMLSPLSDPLIVPASIPYEVRAVSHASCFILSGTLERPWDPLDEIQIGADRAPHLTEEKDGS